MLLSVKENRKIADNIYLLSVDKPDNFSAEAGQFVMLRVNNYNFPFLRRPFSIFDVNKDSILFVYKIMGEGTSILARKNVHETIDILGPFGNFFDVKTDRKIMLVGGGMGVVPLAFLAKTLDKYNVSYSAYFGFNARDEMYVDFGSVSTLDGSFGQKGSVIDIILSNISQGNVIYSCGPIGLLKTLAFLCNDIKCELQVSLESHMACGFGVCLGCTIDTLGGKKKICVDGPIFDYREIIWEKM